MKYRLILTDVDSTLINNEVIDLLAAHAGRGDEVAQITERAMAGQIDFEAALRQRVSLLAGLSDSVITSVVDEIEFMPGAQALIRHCQASSIKIGAVSGGFIEVLAKLGLPEQLDFIRANSLEVRNGKLTGRLQGAIIDRAAKANALIEFATGHQIPLEQTMAIGDGANDIEMIRLAGLGVAFRAKPALREVADLQVGLSLEELIPLLS
jgi:phosphoserine phosphatase